MKTVHIINIVVVFFILTSALTGREEALQQAYDHLAAGEYDKAIVGFETYLAGHPGNARIHLELAYTFLKVKNDDRALDYFLKYLALEPNDLKVRLEAAYVYRRNNRLEKAELQFLAYLKINPRNLDVQADLAYLYITMGETRKAALRMEYILAIDPGRENIRLELAYLLLRENPSRARIHFRILSRSKKKEMRRHAQKKETDYKPSKYGYMLYGALYHSFRFDINVLDVLARVYYKSLPLKLEPYIFAQMSTDAESTINPFPTIYSEQAAIFGAGLQRYLFRRHVRLFVQYGYRAKLLKIPGYPDRKYSFSYGVESFFSAPLGKSVGLDLYNVLVYHSRFDNDYLFEGKETVYKLFETRKAGVFKPYAGVLLRWDSKKYFYNNSYEWVVGIRWTTSRRFTYFLFCEYKRGDYTKETVYGRHYDELLIGLVVGIYK
jgi:Flp pilus assembly protein TadD